MRHSSNFKLYIVQQLNILYCSEPLSDIAIGYHLSKIETSNHLIIVHHS